MIREGHAGDAAAIATIWNRLIRDTVHTFSTVEKTPEGIAATMETQPFIVADQGGTVAGFVSWAPFRGGPGYAFTAEHSIHVAPGAQGTGVGRALMEAAEARARTDRIHSLIAGIGGENGAALAFHAALGFGQVGHIPEAGWKFGRWHDLILMQKML